MEIKQHESKQTDLYNFRFILGNLDDEKLALQITSDLLDNILNVISFRYIVSTYKPVLETINLTGKDTKKFLHSNIKIQSAAQAIMGDPSEDLKNTLKDSKLVNVLATNGYFHMYKSAMALNDPFSRFMFLYSILALLLGNQNKVEAFILSEIPSVKMSERETTFGTKETKTIFTNLRNSVGHVTEKVQFKNIVDEMESHLGQLSVLVKKR